MKNFKDYIVSENISIREALQLIEINDEKCLFAIDKKGTLKGSLTDGDIRRAILQKASFNSKIKRYLYKRPKIINIKDYGTEKISAIPRSYRDEFKLVPVINYKKKILRLINLNRELSKKK